ncbi:flagellar motor protein MotB [Lacihabitans sp. LS3-19]|uniref:OmpA family protein n=1 Tax=Lacihabitans sp. LS3-19 TaxID=2487335 RepID=UPI0020CD0651|nr:OmpA family protein [Lacihabitans sp. LS3-19]MCP9768296.1 flagellar motor protein MotB [Lacihabitans sp. LS3-19]
MHFKNFLVLFFCFNITLGFSQSTSKILKKAETSTKSLSYANAIELYDNVLKKSKGLSPEEIQKVKLNLAEAYYFVKDYKNAEKYYEEVLSNNPTLKGDEIKAFQRYAQVLSSNGKHQESSKIWTKYTELQEHDKRGAQFSKLYANLDPLIRNAESYRIEYVGLNTDSPEFSPTFYKDGLVFVSSRNKSNSVKRVFKWDNSSFLDLYYLEDLKVISKEENNNAALGSGGQSSESPKIKPKTEKLGNDYYTPPTSNDANTIAHQGSDLINGSKNYEENSVIEIKSFSKKLNSKYHEGPCTFYDKATKIIFTRNGTSVGGGIFNNNKKEDITRLKLYYAERKGSDWGNIKELDFNDDKYSCGHPSVNSTDNLLYFVSDMPGGYGGTDLYVSRLINGIWSKPENLGGKVNTVGNEMFPFIDEGGTLYFSSDGLPGLGDLDMFNIATDTKTGKPTGIVRNLGAPLNSNNDDFGIITDRERSLGYFSSNRKRGGSDDDIYKFNRVGPKYGCRDLIVNVFDKETKKSLGVMVFEYSKVSNNIITENATTNNSGSIKLCLEADNDFKFEFKKEGYEEQVLNFSNADASDFEPSTLNVYLKQEVKKVEALVKTEAPKKQRELIQKRSTGGTLNVFRGVITGGEEGGPIAAVKVKFINKCTGEIQEMYTKKDGSYEFKRDPECDYELIASKDDFGTSSEIIEKSIRKTLFGKKVKKPLNTLNLFDTKLFKVGDVIKLENIYYESDAFKIRENAKRDLDNLVATLKKYPNMVIEISSHTDTRGNSFSNLRLSESRAKEVFKYITSKGIDKSRVKAIGKGESEPLNACSDGVQCTEAEHARNRRTEFKILKIEKI